MKGATVLGWSIFGGCVALAVAAAALVLLNLSTPTPRGLSFGPKALEFIFPIGLLAFPAVGALIVATQSGNRIGWTYLTMGLAGEALLFAGQYGVYGVITVPGSLWAGSFVLWTTSWAWAPVSALLPLLIAIFPDGRVLGPRWRFIVWCAAVGAIGQAAADALNSEFDVGTGGARNPLGFGLSDEVRVWLYVAGTLVWSVAMIGAIASLVARYRRSRRVARQQIKWFVYAGAVSGVIIVPATFAYGTEFTELFTAASGVSVLAIPVATAIAIFRYRLYDIDLLINRTVVYAATTAAIAATFFIGIVALQAVLRPLTAGSELAVAASTLVSFALFQPIRRRVQGAVDRRFDRSRYDAARTLEAFADRLRDEVDLHALRSDLLVAVERTMAPAHANLWLRDRAR